MIWGAGILLKVTELIVSQGKFQLKANFSVLNGDRIAIIGPSGGGKSTLLSSIAGFIEAKSGVISLNRSQILGLPPDQVPCTLLFQHNNLFPHLNVFNNVALGISPNLRLNSKEKNKVYESLARVDLSEKSKSMPSSLSGGQLSRVALARALIRNRPLLMLDEAFGALGPAQRIEMLNYVKEIVANSKIILLMVTHDPLDAKRIANKVIFVDNGVVHKPVTVDSFFDKPSSSVKRYLGI